MRVVSAALFASVLTAFVAASLGACSSAHARKPAWPKQTEREVDGGESLAPRSATAVAARDADDDAGDDDAVVTAKPTPTPTAPTATDAKPTPTTSTPSVIEELVITEEIVIEIDDE